jgi:uncharacterized protein
MNLIALKIISFCTVLTFASPFAWARSIPSLTGPVVDEANMLSPQASMRLQNALREFQQTYEAQVQVLIINTLDGDSIEDFSIKVTDQWKLGDAKRDDGLLFLVVVKDRLMRIEVGQGLEGTITDLEAGRIIQNVRAYFKNGQFEEGIFAGIKLITEKIIQVEGGDNSESQANSSHPRKKGIKNLHSFINSFFFFLFIVCYLLFFVFGRRGGGRGGYYGNGGGWSGGGGSGGNWGGGGGGFSGGGASGKW